ncbi:MAG: ABC transporter permease, partial [Chloroflexota bacterium]|nr:ABC transporter permease [Chloroflexota bacterium]
MDQIAQYVGNRWMAILSSILRVFRRNWGRFGLLFVNLAFWGFFAWKAEGFLTEFNIYTLLRFASIQITIGMAQMVALSAGELDLSVGAIGGVVAMFAGGLMEVLGLPPLLAAGLGLLLAALAGVINGLLITRTGINSFVITLATSSIFSGLML